MTQWIHCKYDKALSIFMYSRKLSLNHFTIFKIGLSEIYSLLIRTQRQEKESREDSPNKIKHNELPTKTGTMSCCLSANWVQFSLCWTADVFIGQQLPVYLSSWDYTCSTSFASEVVLISWISVSFTRQGSPNSVSVCIPITDINFGAYSI